MYILKDVGFFMQLAVGLFDTDKNTFIYRTQTRIISFCFCKLQFQSHTKFRTRF